MSNIKLIKRTISIKDILSSISKKTGIKNGNIIILAGLMNLEQSIEKKDKKQSVIEYIKYFEDTCNEENVKVTRS